MLYLLPLFEFLFESPPLAGATWFPLVIEFFCFTLTLFADAPLPLLSSPAFFTAMPSSYRLVSCSRSIDCSSILLLSAFDPLPPLPMTLLFMGDIMFSLSIIELLLLFILVASFFPPPTFTYREVCIAVFPSNIRSTTSIRF